MHNSVNSIFKKTKPEVPHLRGEMGEGWEESGKTGFEKIQRYQISRGHIHIYDAHTSANVRSLLFMPFYVRKIKEL